MSDHNISDSGAVAADPVIAATVATAPAEDRRVDDALTDIARDVACSTWEMMKLEGPDPTENAVRVLLLAAVEMLHPINIYGQATPISSMLMQAMKEATDAYVEPVGDKGDRPSLTLQKVARLRVASLAGIRGDDAPPVLSPTMTLEAAKLAQRWLRTLRPPVQQEGADDEE